ncbi:MAG: trehalose-phosphatase, partial [Bdellovibrionota bacterium]
SAYKMPKEERTSRMQSLQEILSRYSATEWAKSFLKDLEVAGRVRPKKSTVRLESSQSYEAIAERIRSAKKCKFILDYDGTLVALQKRPELALLSVELRNKLEKLNKKIPVAVVSGRAKSFLDSQFPNAPLLLAAEHGGYYKEPGSEWRSRISSDIGSWYPEVDRVMTDYAEKVPLSFVEAKEAALVWHYRMSPNDFATYQARKLDEELQTGLANRPVSIIGGSKMVEARAVECDKGSFLRWLLEQDGGESLFICIGDDRTDEDMFRVLGQQGISVKVGSADTLAQYRVARQDEVFQLIEAITSHAMNAQA